MVDAVLEIMQKAVIPWTNVVEKLVQHYLEMEGPKYVDTVTLVLFIAIVFFSLISRISIIFYSRQELLKESFVLMEIRKLLRSYGIRNFNLSNRTQIMVKKKTKHRFAIFFHLYSAEFSFPNYIFLFRHWSDTSWSKTCQHLWMTRWCSLQLTSSQRRRFTIFMSSSWPLKEK